MRASWGIVAGGSVLAGMRPLLKERNYAAYATVKLSTVGYRLIDTVIGCLIAIVPTLLLRRRNVG
ncbi:hypothetical protein ACIA58_04520 [Kribbella sp. NPDC051586]|uniref:hypothetical protein n=1 Tax=Kribbella sp. NPDC051586 TaxID=3364118 RepID=UPI003799F41C